MRFFLTLLLLVVGCSSEPLEPRLDPRIYDAMCEDLGRPVGELPPHTYDPRWMGCRFDSECVDGDEGRCSVSGPFSGTCSYHDCWVDDDCSEGQRCVCGVGTLGRNRCLVDECEGECAAEFCTVDFGCDGVAGIRGPSAVTCRSSRDRCEADEDCEGTERCTKRDGGFVHPRFVCVISGCSVH